MLNVQLVAGEGLIAAMKREQKACLCAAARIRHFRFAFKSAVNQLWR
jgi:hypothetical protein